MNPSRLFNLEMVTDLEERKKFNPVKKIDLVADLGCVEGLVNTHISVYTLSPIYNYTPATFI